MASMRLTTTLSSSKWKSEVSDLRQSGGLGIMNPYNSEYGPPGNPCTPKRGRSRGGARRLLSPHPDPLPRGEGTASIAQWKADGCGLFSRRSRIHPLPKGEGRGEGERREVPPAYRTNPGIVELGDYSGRSGGFVK